MLAVRTYLAALRSNAVRLWVDGTSLTATKGIPARDAANCSPRKSMNWFISRPPRPTLAVMMIRGGSDDLEAPQPVTKTWESRCTPRDVADGVSPKQSR